MTYAEASRLFDARDRAVVSCAGGGGAALRRRGQNGTVSASHRAGRCGSCAGWPFTGGAFTATRPMGAKPSRSIGTMHRCHHLKETEAALRESELRLRLALEAAQMGAFEADICRRNGDDRCPGGASARPTGGHARCFRRRAAPRGLPLADLRGEAMPKRTMERHAQAYHHEFRLRMPNGAERWLSAHAAIRAGSDRWRKFSTSPSATRAEEALRESEARACVLPPMGPR